MAHGIGGRHNLDFLIAGLQGGWMEPSQAASTYMGFQQDEQAEAEQQRQMLQAMQQEGLDVLRQQSLNLATDEAYQSPDVMKDQLRGVAQMYGMPKIPGPIKQGLSTLASTQQIPFDQEDQDEIVKQVFLQKNQMGRAQIRESIRSRLVAGLGPEGYAQIQGRVNEVIDQAYAGQLMPTEF